MIQSRIKTLLIKMKVSIFNSFASVKFNSREVSLLQMFKYVKLFY